MVLSIYVAFRGTNLELVIPVCEVCDVTQIVSEAELFFLQHLSFVDKKSNIQALKFLLLLRKTLQNRRGIP
jgi:hypothetical protein